MNPDLKRLWVDALRSGRYLEWSGDHLDSFLQFSTEAATSHGTLLRFGPSSNNIDSFTVGYKFTVWGVLIEVISAVYWNPIYSHLKTIIGWRDGTVPFAAVVGEENFPVIDLMIRDGLNFTDIADFIEENL